MHIFLFISWQNSDQSLGHDKCPFLSAVFPDSYCIPRYVGLLSPANSPKLLIAAYTATSISSLPSTLESTLLGMKNFLSNFVSFVSSTLPHREGGVENVCHNSVISISNQSPGLMSPILQHKALCFLPLDCAFILYMCFEIYDIHHNRF